MPRIDYDAVAERYDEPERDHATDERLVAFLEEKAILPDAAVILDVGCGTGKQLAANRTRLPRARLVGVDRSRRMLAVARRRCAAVQWVQADALALPFGPEQFHYASSQYSYHHIGRPPAFFADLFRVLRPGGRFVLTNIDPWAMPGWLVYQYFPEALTVDRGDFLPLADLGSALGAAGFEGVRVETCDLSRDEDLRVFLRYATARHRASQLTAISDDSYSAGLRRLQADIAAAGDASRLVRSEFVRVTFTADRPPVPDS